METTPLFPSHNQKYPLTTSPISKTAIKKRSHTKRQTNFASHLAFQCWIVFFSNSTSTPLRWTWQNILLQVTFLKLETLEKPTIRRKTKLTFVTVIKLRYVCTNKVYDDDSPEKFPRRKIWQMVKISYINSKLI